MTEPRCYTVPQLLERLQMTARTFRRQRKAGALPFLEELKPRIGRTPRYRCDLVDSYLEGTWRPTPARVFFHSGGARSARKLA